MQMTKQVSIFLENKPGRLANVLTALAREKVNITALTVMDSHEHSVLRIVADDLTRMTEVLKTLGAPFSESDVIVVELRNQPGALAHVCELLAADRINVEYAYCSAGGRNGKTLGIFKVSSNDRALKVLSAPVDVSKRRRLDNRPIRDKRNFAKP